MEKRVELIPPTSQEEVDVLTTIGNLSNTVIANQASRSLAKYVRFINLFFGTTT